MAEAPSRGDVAINQASLDFLRGIAALYVVLNHARGNFWIGGKALLAADPTIVNYVAAILLQFTSLGTEFVVLFFVLSGFAMRHSVRHSTSTRRFYLKRLLRIWPPYVAAVLFALACEAMTGGTAVRDKLVRMLFYVDVSTPLTPQFWSLTYEVLFYLICPLILVNVRRVRIVGGVALAASAMTLMLNGPALNQYQYIILNFIGYELLFFLSGAICYDYLGIVPRIKPHILAVIIGIVMIFAWAVNLLIGGSNMISGAAMVILSVLAIRNTPDRFSRSKWVNWGFFSYSIYIFHYAVIAVLVYGLGRLGVAHLQIRSPVAWIASVPIIVMICFALYFIAERWSNRLVAMLRTPRAAAQAH